MKVPFLVELAWTTVDSHRQHKCPECADGCPNVDLARARILAWRRAVGRAPIQKW